VRRLAASELSLTTPAVTLGITRPERHPPTSDKEARRTSFESACPADHLLRQGTALRIQAPGAILGVSASWPTHAPRAMHMNNVRTYGTPPFNVAVIHGGPGAPGELAPVARELAKARGVLEPLQTASTVQGQIAELETVLKQKAQPPVALIGHSWGALLSFIFAAQCPSLVKRLILVSSGVFEDKYAEHITATRLSRLTEPEMAAVDSLSTALDDPYVTDKNRLFAELGNVISRADAFDPVPSENEVIECQYDIYRSVWKDAQQLRSSGRLLALGTRIRCPVVAIHGDYDPHPSEGVRIPLSRVLADFTFILLENCGHRPWVERAARDEFYRILEEQPG
jgi:pimeloyl-ACP methyl ester carboxylesterase